MSSTKETLKNGSAKSSKAAGLKLSASTLKNKAKQAAVALKNGKAAKSGPNGKAAEKKNGVVAAEKAPAKLSGKINFRLEPKLLVRIHDFMVKSRVLEERLIRMYKQSDGYFWIGGPGEEAFNVPLALQIKKGSGPKYDFMHLHYRSAAIMTTLGMEPIDAMRQMKNTATDPFSGGRNFSNHFSKREWNVVPITSTIETQYQSAIGTGISQRRHGGDGITIVNGGDAGTAEGDFASCLVWSSRPGFELPILIIVTNNKWGISTSSAGQHGEKNVADRGRAFGIKCHTINGNDVEESWYMLKECMDYIRTERKPVLIESNVSRLYGHSSATGCNFITSEEDCLATFEQKLALAGVLSKKEMDQIREKYTQEMLELSQKVREEPLPDPSTIYDYTYFGQRGKYF